MSRAYFHAQAHRPVLVRLLAEDREHWIVDKSRYGTRDAAQNWEEEIGAFLEAQGLRKGTASPGMYNSVKTKTTDREQASLTTRLHESCLVSRIQSCSKATASPLWPKIARTMVLTSVQVLVSRDIWT